MNDRMDQHFATHGDIERMRADILQRIGELEVRLVERVAERQVDTVERAAQCRPSGREADGPLDDRPVRRPDRGPDRTVFGMIEVLR